MPSDDNVGRGKKQDDGQHDDHRAVEHRYVPGEGHRGIRQERAEDRDQHDDSGRQQGEQAASADPLQVPDGATAGHG